MEFARLSSKGQLTLPVAIRQSLRLREGDVLLVYVEGREVRMKKALDEAGSPLAEDDPIWRLIGVGESGLADVSKRHDQYVQPLAGGKGNGAG